MAPVMGLYMFRETTDTNKITKRIVNGQPITRGRWPFLVSLHFKKNDPFTSESGMKHVCGGTLIYPRWVLTAAHCIGIFKEHVKPQNWEVVIGEYNQFVDDEDQQVIQPEAFFIYPNFVFRYNAESFEMDNDIALIKLKRPAVLGDHVSILRMDDRPELGVNLKCKVGGWGQLSARPYGWGMYILLKTTQYIFDSNYCKEVYDKLNEEGVYLDVDDSWLCAGVPLVNQSTMEKERGGVSSICYGDSGGPLICKTESGNNYVLSGIASAMKECGSSLYPGLFTKVAYFQDWIQNVTGHVEPNTAKTSLADAFVNVIAYLFGLAKN